MRLRSRVTLAALVLLAGCHWVLPLETFIEAPAHDAIGSPEAATPPDQALADREAIAPPDLADQREAQAPEDTNITPVEGWLPQLDAGGLKCTPTLSVKCPLGWCPIKSSTFQMGASTALDPCVDSASVIKETHHAVTLTHSFEIAFIEVTQSQYMKEKGVNPSKGPSVGGCFPVQNVTWHDAAEYCNGLSTEIGYQPCYSCSGSGASLSCDTSPSYLGQKIYDCPGYRLPTEAEWELAHRAGSLTSLHNGLWLDVSACDDCTVAVNSVDPIAWYCANTSGGPQQVAKKQPNSWGLHDMAGNVGEWCHDSMGSANFDLGSAPVTDPVFDSPQATYRVVRGGYWSFAPRFVRTSARDQAAAGFKADRIGFRCARTTP